MHDIQLNPFTTERNQLLDVLSEKCSLYKDFTIGTGLNQAEILHLCSNMLNLEKGYETMLSYANNDDFMTWFKFLDTLKELNPEPSRCTSSNCNHILDCKNCNTIKSKLTVDKGKISLLKEKEFKTLTDAETELEQKFLEFLNSEDKNIKILKAPTGIGKTELYVKYSKPKTWYCVPTHALRKEVTERLIIEKDPAMKILYKKENKTEEEIKKVNDYINSVLENNDWLITIGQIPFVDEEFNAKIDELESAGNYKNAKRLVTVRVEQYLELEKAGVELTKEQKDLIKYEKDRKELETTKKIVVLTHAKLLYINSCAAENIIIDEDIITSLIQIKPISLRDIKLTIEAIKGDTKSKEKNRTDAIRHVKAAFRFLDNLEDGIITEIPYRSITAKARDTILKGVRSAEVKTDVLDFLKSKYVLKQTDENGYININYVTKVNLCDIVEDINTIIMSATINKKIWELYAEEELTFHDIGLVKGTGSVYQYGKKSFSRRQIQALDKFENEREQAIKERFKYVKDRIGDIPVISYSICQNLEHLNFQKGLWFGNTAGKDFLKGQNIAVVGTPSVPPIVYALWASCLGIKCTMDDFREDTSEQKGGMKYQNIIHNNFSYWSFTFNNQLLRELQIFLISEELYQSIGRSRSIRFDCNTYVFTNIPIEGAILLDN